MNNIIEILFENAKKYSDKIAIVHKNKKITYREFLVKTLNYSQHFLSKGLSKGDNILIFTPMSIELYIILAAVFNIGAAAVFLDAWADKKRLEEALTIVPCKAFLGCPKAYILKLFSSKIREIPLNFVSGFIKKVKTNIEIPNVDSKDTALITFTTGSTGFAKAANRTHGFLLEQHRILKKHLKPEINDVDLVSLPIFVLHNLACATTSVIPDFNPRKPSKFNPKKVLRDIKKYNVTTSVGSAAFYENLVKKQKIGGIKRIFTGGSPVFPKAAKKLRENFINSQIEIIYGSTEAEPISSISASSLIANTKDLKKGLLVGKPIEEIDIRIIKPTDEKIEDFESSIVENGVVGEICVAGDHVLKEYYNCDTAQEFAKINYNGNIYHRTGDGGFLDENGNLFLVGRIKNRFQYKDKTFYTFPIENALLEIPGVEMGTILRINSLVVIVLESKLPKEQLAKTLIDRGFELDKLIVTKIPRDKRHNSKIDYEKLKNSIISYCTNP